ncbi:Coiled-coil domain-containing protein 65 [Habropoda laboriosa]|uniref:Coiled-coil domain-containing protein 65 n=1 Tax=Habropoda laboriosa TaxID=597456 RepID=A0A0L7RJ79_9HYME|nr:Coiled-coil domain-containing protein 65 [Habropoda laboriosa]
MAPKRKRKPQRDKTNRDLNRETLFREINRSGFGTERYLPFSREMVARVKMPDIERKVEMAWQTLEHAIDLKDYRISLLLDSLQEAQEQRRSANNAHVEIIDRTLLAHQARLQRIDTLFYGNLETTLAHKVRRLKDINDCQNEEEIALRKINLLVNYRGVNASSVARSTAISKIDAFMEDGKNETRIITTQLQNKLENLWNHLRNIFSDYLQRTQDRRKAYETIKKKDEVDLQTITRQYLRTATLLEETAKFRETIHSYRIESAIRIREITQQANSFHNIYRETNQRFASGCKIDKHRITSMSKEYSRTVENLKGWTMKAQRILALVKISRKYETQDEKILPTIDCHPALQLPTTEIDVPLLEMVTT